MRYWGRRQKEDCGHIPRTCTPYRKGRRPRKGSQREEESVTSLKPRAGREFLFSYMPWRLGAVKKLELRRSQIKLLVYFKE